MIVHVRKLLNQMKYFVWFVLLTFVMFYLVQFIYGWIEPAQRYKEPSGRAVKVFQQYGSVHFEDTFVDRLRFFYWYGE